MQYVLFGVLTLVSALAKSLDIWNWLPFPQVDIVTEKRLYRKFSERLTGPGDVELVHGILAARQELNRLHHSLANQGYFQVPELSVRVNW